MLLAVTHRLLAIGIGGLALPLGSAANLHTPVISSVTPSTVAVGQPLTVAGRGFAPGHGKAIVVFVRGGQRAVFVKADQASSTRIRVVVPPCRLLPFMAYRAGKPQPTRFRIGVLANVLSPVASRYVTVTPGVPTPEPASKPGVTVCRLNLSPTDSPTSALRASGGF